MDEFKKSLKFDKPLRHTTANRGEVEYRFSRSDLDKFDTQAFERGRQAGEERLGQEMIELRREVAELQSGLFESLRRAHRKIAEECEQALVEMSLAVAEKIVAGIEIDREQVTGAINEALAQFDECAEYDIQLNPEDLKLIADGEHAQDEKFRLHASDEVSRGGCIVRTQFGTIDARRETRFTLLKETVTP